MLESQGILIQASLDSVFANRALSHLVVGSTKGDLMGCVVVEEGAK